MQLSIRKLSPDIRVILSPLVVILILVVLFSLLFKNGYLRVKGKIAQYKEARQTELALENKLKKLREVKSEVLEKTAVVVIAVPEENLTPLVAFALRNSASEKEISIDKLSVLSSDTNEELKNMEINIELKSEDFPQLLSFLKEILNSAPVTTIDKLEIKKRTETEVGHDAKFSLKVYWADLPKVLPKLTEPVSNLTSEQEVLLSKIQELKKPDVVTFTPQPARENPLPFQ